MVCIYIFRHCRERRTKTKKPAGISNEGQINGISLRSFLEREPHQCIQCGAAAELRLCRSDGGAGFGGTEAEILASGHGVGCMDERKSVVEGKKRYVRVDMGGVP